MYPTNASGKKSVFVKYHEKYMKKRVHEVKYIQTFEPEGASVAKWRSNMKQAATLTNELRDKCYEGASIKSMNDCARELKLLLLDIEHAEIPWNQ